MSSLSPNLVAAVDQFSAFTRHCGLSVVDALVLAQAARHLKNKDRCSDFDLVETDTIVGTDGALVELTLASLTARGLMKCTDPEKSSYFELAGDGVWMGKCAELLADEADAAKQATNIYQL